VATRNHVVVKDYLTYVYPNRSWTSYQTPEQEGRAFLLFLHEATKTPTPAPESVESSESSARQRLRKGLVKAALKGTLIGLTNSGVKEGACLQTALFALETAEQMLFLMDATPLQRRLLSVLTLETLQPGFRAMNRSNSGSLDNQDHPLCRFVQQYGLD
jgi:hypothetical protein